MKSITRILASCVVVGLTVSAAAAQTGTEARAAARRHREANEAKILREFSTLLAMPNVASSRADIRRNADHLTSMLRQRGATAQILEVPERASVGLSERSALLERRAPSFSTRISTDNPSIPASGRVRRSRRYCAIKRCTRVARTSLSRPTASAPSVSGASTPARRLTTRARSSRCSPRSTQCAPRTSRPR